MATPEAEKPKGLIGSAHKLKFSLLDAIKKTAENAQVDEKWKRFSKEDRLRIDQYMDAYVYLLAREERKKYAQKDIETIIVPAVQVFLFRNGPKGVEVFLGKRLAGGFKGQWCVPGGKKDEGESFEMAAIRELIEETGAEVDLGSLVHIRDHLSQTLREKNGVTRNVEHRIKAYAVMAHDLNPTNASPEEHEEMKWLPVVDAISMHEEAIRGVPEDADEDTIENAIPSGALGLMREFQNYATVEEALEARNA